MPTAHPRKTTDTKGRERLVQAKLPAELVKALRIHALERETTVKELLTRLVRDYLEREGFPTKRLR